VLAACPQNLDVLRAVDVVSPVPVLAHTAQGANLVIGYCPETKIFSDGQTLDIIPPDLAAKVLLQVLRDFDFQTAGDQGRAIAMLLTLALAKGGFLGSGRAPFFMIEKDQRGAGGGTLVRLAAAIHGVIPVSITPDDPKSAREDISKHLREGTAFINFDNIRGKVLAKLPFFESMLTEPEFTCRAPYVHVTANVQRCVFVCTSNGALLSPDLADRTVRIGIRKRELGYPFQQYDKGSLLDHAAAHQPVFLGSIFGLIKDWADKDRPRGQKLTGFRFPEWERACAWIIENHFPDLALLDKSHTAAQERMANTDSEMLRAVFQLVISDRPNDFLSPTEFVRLAMQTGHMETDDKSNVMKMGRVLAEEFSTVGVHEFANEFRITRRDDKNKDSNYEPMKKYQVAPLERIPK
jgi:hypothetical protein